MPPDMGNYKIFKDTYKLSSPQEKDDTKKSKIFCAKDIILYFFAWTMLNIFWKCSVFIDFTNTSE